MSWSNTSKTSAASFTNVSAHSASMTNQSKNSLNSFRLLIDNTHLFLLDSINNLLIGGNEQVQRFSNLAKS